MSAHTITMGLLRQSPALPALVRFLNKQCCAGFGTLGQSRLMSKKSSTQTRPPFQAAHPALHANIPNRNRQKRNLMNTMSMVTIWEDLKQIPFSPTPALVLGLAGLIPFVSPPVYMLLSQTYSAPLAFAQTVYGACILSFLGGVRWGFAIPEGSRLKADWFNLGTSVAPSLVAFFALLLPQPLSVLTVIGGIAGAAYFDTVIKGYPAWFKGLRFALSFGAVLSLWTVFLCKFILRSRSDSQRATAGFVEEDA